MGYGRVVSLAVEGHLLLCTGLHSRIPVRSRMYRVRSTTANPAPFPYSVNRLNVLQRNCTFVCRPSCYLQSRRTLVQQSAFAELWASRALRSRLVQCFRLGRQHTKYSYQSRPIPHAIRPQIWLAFLHLPSAGIVSRAAHDAVGHVDHQGESHIARGGAANRRGS